MPNPIGGIGKGITNATKIIADVVETVGEVAEKTATKLPEVAEKAAQGTEKVAESVGKIGNVGPNPAKVADDLLGDAINQGLDRALEDLASGEFSGGPKNIADTDGPWKLTSPSRFGMEKAREKASEGVGKIGETPSLEKKTNPAKVADELLGDAKSQGIESALTDLSHGDFSGKTPVSRATEKGTNIIPFPQRPIPAPGVPKVPRMEEGTKSGSYEKQFGEGKKVTDEELSKILEQRNSMVHPEHLIPLSDIPLVHHTVYSDFAQGHYDIFQSLSVTSKALLDKSCKEALAIYKKSPTKVNAQNLETALDNSTKRITWREKTCPHGVPKDQSCAQCIEEKAA